MIAPPKPPRDELELLIKEARQRQLRRRLLGAAAVAIVAAIGLGIYALTGGNGDRSATDGSPRDGAPACRARRFGRTSGTCNRPTPSSGSERATSWRPRGR